jgi:hypothetical protein
LRDTKGENRGSGKAGFDQWKHDDKENLKGARAIHAWGFFQLDWHLHN